MILFNSFQKKSQKTPKKEILKADRLKKQYFNEKNKLNKANVNTASDLLDAKYGKTGTKSRNEFQEEAHRFYISEMLKEARKEAKLTQSELADKIGTKKSYISKIENRKGNITLETLIKIFESGLHKKVGISIS